MTKKIHKRHAQSASKPVTIPLSTDERKAHNLPMPGPGVVVKVPLLLVPAYLQLYGLVPLAQPDTDPVGSREVVLKVQRIQKIGAKG